MQVFADGQRILSYRQNYLAELIVGAFFNKLLHEVVSKRVTHEFWKFAYCIVEDDLVQLGVMLDLWLEEAAACLVLCQYDCVRDKALELKLGKVLEALETLIGWPKIVNFNYLLHRAVLVD